MPILGVGVEHVDKGLFGEAGDLLLYGLSIPDSVALRKGVVGLSWSRWSMMEERKLLFRNTPIVQLAGGNQRRQ